MSQAIRCLYASAEVFLEEYVDYFYLGFLLVGLAIWKIKPLHAAPLFIWGFSMPLTFFSYLVWIYGSGGDHWTLPMLCIELLALAQLGWLGGLCALLGQFSRLGGLKKAGLVISIISVAGHSIFLGGIMALGYGS